MKEIESFIDHLECPLINGIVFPDRTIQLFEIEVSWENPVEFKLQASSVTSIDNFEKEGELSWCSCAILNQYVDKTGSIKAFCGEGSYGSDGFVCVMNLEREKVIWIAYFTSSNPFHKVTIKEGQVIAISTLDCIWKFNLDMPSVIEVMSHL
ncbi:hypothetical protein SNE26_16120 [Mucilaginibacter sp. cycad4]|uniref:hypothetical protein n=1 Tax=Mucilaginibacter sp. cycad4 TaxID=3342096 RepID=UPI002AABB7DC|nr:hypothetical protein [Mucilaginibacter gossypii]WPU97553.1 hypothetical protein SNE26_16120 [Mucilaginibacter gossypii]